MKRTQFTIFFMFLNDVNKMVGRWCKANGPTKVFLSHIITRTNIVVDKDVGVQL